MKVSSLEQVLRRDRLVISIVLGALTLLSWAQMLLPNDGSHGGERATHAVLPRRPPRARSPVANAASPMPTTAAVA